VQLSGPAYAPNKVRVTVSKTASQELNEANYAGQPQIFSEESTKPLPAWPLQKRQMYPHTAGFTYVIAAVEDCLLRNACKPRPDMTPSERQACLRSNVCHSMPEMSSEEQILVMEITESAIKTVRGNL